MLNLPGASFGSTSSQASGVETGAPGNLAHGVGRHDRLREAVAERIEIDPPLPRRDPLLHRHLLRIRGGEPVPEPLGELLRVVGVRAHHDRDEDVHPLLAGRLRKRDEAEGVERLLHLQAGARRVGELPGVRIEIEADPVRLARVLLARAPDVDGDAAEVRRARAAFRASRRRRSCGRRSRGRCAWSACRPASSPASPSGRSTFP